MKLAQLLTAGVLISQVAHAQTTGKPNVDKLCGCYSVNFQYAETFSPDENYKFHDREDMNAMELALPIENTDKKVVIQHLLVIADTMVIKHWREEWTYENPALYEYKGEKKWEKKMLAATDSKGKWTQTVWEVNDEPRYQGVSAWMHNDGKTFWESTVDAPLPRREYTVRNDYNILKRRNRIMLTNDGYVHEQDNEKILREGGKDKLIALEKGYNTYHKAEESDCTVAREWWKKNSPFWSVVKNEWENYIAKNDRVNVKSTVDDKILGDHFTALWKEWNSKKITDDQLPGKVKEVLAKFL
jgi:hypothetical protein